MKPAKLLKHSHLKALQLKSVQLRKLRWDILQARLQAQFQAPWKKRGSASAQCQPSDTVANPGPSDPATLDKSKLSLPQITFASGLVFSSVLAAQLIPIPISPLQRLGSAETAESVLWESTGSIRQSIVALYRAERVLLPLPTAQQTEAKPPTGATPPKSGTQPTASKAEPQSTAASKPTTAKASNPAPATTSGIARPPVPPPPMAQKAAVNPNTTIDANLEMRVAIARNVSSLEVGVSSAGYLMTLDGQNYCNLPAQTSYLARPTAQGIDFGNGCQLSTAVWLESAEGGYVYINDSWFKGRVLLLNEGGSLIAVNFVLLQDYLSSVVGSEMYVNWPIEALKAQAVAARSYALTHHVRPASRHYDLDNTQRYQAYLGVAKETNTTQIAVTETSGEFISYDGGIVESLYAASDQIVQDVHGGMGMSQNGAMQLASQGYDYSQILGTYYPGTSLARLVVK